jgi:hypothetical protein
MNNHYFSRAFFVNLAHSFGCDFEQIEIVDDNAKPLGRVGWCATSKSTEGVLHLRTTTTRAEKKRRDRWESQTSTAERRKTYPLLSCPTRIESPVPTSATVCRKTLARKENQASVDKSLACPKRLAFMDWF